MKSNKILYKCKNFTNLREMMNNTIELYSDNIAFKIKEKNSKKVFYKEITYKEFGEDINGLGTSLIDLGLKGKRIAIIGKNRYEWVLSYISILNGVGIVVPLDKNLREDEIVSSIQRSKVDAIIFEEEYISIINTLKGFSSSLKYFICMNDINNSDIINISNLINRGKKLLSSGDERYINSEIDENEMATIIFTSGTTSMSKAVMLSHKNIVSNINDMNCVEKVYSTDVNMVFLPLHHTFGSTGLLFFVANGATNVFCDGLRYIQSNLKEYGVSIFVCVPLLLESMYKKIIAEIEKQGKLSTIQKGIKLSNFLLSIGIDVRRKIFKPILDKLGGNLRFIISGASAIDKNVAKAFNDFGILTVQGYGLTETSPTLAAENIKAIRYGSCGLAMNSVELRIDNPNEKGIGELIAKGPNVMLGYYENEAATNEVLKDGWFYTGDLAYIDKDGFLFITGRKKNVIVLKNGKNIYPEELELLINKLPYVAESMVFGKPKNDDLLLSVKIVYNEDYVKDKYSSISENDLKELIWKDIKEINSSMPNYKHIKNLIITSTPMIKTTTAKIKRFEEIKKEES